MFSSVLELVTSGQDLSASMMEEVIRSMLSGTLPEDKTEQLLIALQKKGESVSELVGAARAMRAAMTRVRTSHPMVLDTCGTGGDGSQTFNISTAAAIVIAAAGVPVAKHGNRKITSSTGSADVLAEFGINLDAPVEIVERCLAELKICFCFAPRFHPAMKHVAEVRRRISGPTIFNRLGPLCNPASAAYQVLGVGRSDLQSLLADALQQLEPRRAIVVRGEDGVDEVSLEVSTTVIDVTPNGKRTFQWHPSDFGLMPAPRASLFADSPTSSAQCIREALSGRPGPCRDVVVLNAAAGLWLVEENATPQSCARRAQAAIDSGTAAELLQNLANLTNQSPTAPNSP
ncbi:MAG: anthranilate phosphoribosyltransferase [Pirellulales bacterium]